MKKSDLAEIKKMDGVSIEKKIKDLKKSLAESVIEKNMGKQKNLKLNWKTKKEIAVLKTILNQKKMLAKYETQEKGEIKAS